FRGWHRDHVEAGAHASAQQLDEWPRRRAGAKAEPHARLDEIERAGSGFAFVGLGVHGGGATRGFGGIGCLPIAGTAGGGKAGKIGVGTPPCQPAHALSRSLARGSAWRCPPPLSCSTSTGRWSTPRPT